MIEYLIWTVGIPVFVWLLGYGYTLRQLGKIPGFPINKRMLLVSWPLTLLAIEALDQEAIVEDFLDEMEED